MTNPFTIQEAETIRRELEAGSSTRAALEAADLRHTPWCHGKRQILRSGACIAKMTALEISQAVGVEPSEETSEEHIARARELGAKAYPDGCPSCKAAVDAFERESSCGGYDYTVHLCSRRRSGPCVWRSTHEGGDL